VVCRRFNRVALIFLGNTIFNYVLDFEVFLTLDNIMLGKYPFLVIIGLISGFIPAWVLLEWISSGGDSTVGFRSR